MRNRPVVFGASKLLVVLLFVEALVITFFAWSAWSWQGWTNLGPSAFPGSPDAAYLYYASRNTAIWSGRFLIGAWIIVVSLLVIHSNSTSKQGVSRVLSGTLIGLPVLAWMAAHAVGAST